MDRALSQEEIDSLFQNVRGKGVDHATRRAVRYDFRRPDRISKDQLRAIHLLHDTFARNLASSLSAYLRAYVMVNLISVEQLSYAEFSQCLPSPTCLASLAMKPYEGNAVLEIGSSLVFPILEMLLGGNGKDTSKISREVTELEQVVLDGLYRIILHDLGLAWHGVAPIEFSIETRETEPQLLQIMAPNEAVVAIALEVRIAENTGMINIGMPSIVIKMLRQRFDQQWSVRRFESTAEDQARILGLLKPALVELDVRLMGPVLTVSDLLQVEVGNVLNLDCSIDAPVSLMVNGQVKYQGFVGTTGRKKAFVVQHNSRPAPE